MGSPLAVAAAGLAFCGNLAACAEPPRPVVALVSVPAGELGKLTGATLTEGGVRLGPADFAGPELIAQFKEECATLQTGKAASGGDRTGGYGKVYRGRQPLVRIPKPSDGVFRWVEGDAEYLDPGLISETAGSNLAVQMFEPLLAIAPGNTPPVPGQAERWEMSSDGRTYTLHLRPGLVWSDGVPITAEDFRYAWLRVLDRNFGSKTALHLWQYIEGAKAYYDGTEKDPAKVGIRVLDPLTIEVRLRQPTPWFAHMLTEPPYMPVPRHAVEAHGNRWTLPENLVVNGPYRMTYWAVHDRIEMKKNPRYWDAAQVAIEAQVITMSADEAKNVRLYESGHAHWIRPLPPDRAKEWIQAGRDDLHIDQNMCTYYYNFRTNRPPFDNRLVRQAINLAIDKERMTKHILTTYPRPATSLVTDMFADTTGYLSTPGDAYDPERARQLLAEAGYPGGVGLPPIELLYNTFEVHRLIAEFVQRNLKDNLGITVLPGNMEWKSLLKLMRAGEFHLGRGSWCADFPDPYSFLEVLHSESENNYSNYKNPHYDALLAAYLAEADPTRRNQLGCVAEKVLNRDVPFSPFYFYTRAYMLRPFVRGFEPQYRDEHLVKYLRFEEP
jgi:oligopeptide transport system substrate-binding protein